jgi:replicative DNA helicase
VNLDLGLVGSVIKEKAFLLAAEKGVTVADFSSEGEIAIWKFLEEYFSEHRTIPSRELVEAKFEVSIPEPQEGIGFWITEIKKRTLYNELNETFVKVQSAMNKDDSLAAYAELREFVKAQERSQGGGSVVEVRAVKEIVKQRYLDAKAGKMGIRTPWPQMDAWTMGWWPKDVSFVSARTGIGKTFCAVAMAKKARQEGESVLFISGEMSKEDLAGRFFAMEFQANYGGFRKGKLSTMEEQRFLQELDQYNPAVDIEIMDAEKGFSTIDIERAIERTKAKLVIVDACYRVKARQKTRDRMENMALVADDLKTYSMVYSKSIIGTTQLNRDSTKKKKGDMGLEDLAMSDVLGWNATNVFGLVQLDEDVESGQMSIYPLKVREGENSKNALKVRWDFTRMDFSEVGIAPSGPRRVSQRDEDEDWG